MKEIKTWQIRTAVIPLALSLALTVSGASVFAAADHYPSKPVRLIVPIPPGSSPDSVGRVIAAKLSERLGKQVIVENHGGAGGVLGSEMVSKSVPDGYTLLLIAVGVFAVGEIISNLSDPEDRLVFTSKVGSLYPTLQDMRQSIAPIIRGTALGAFLGVLPGTGPAIASFASYMIEKKVAKDPSRFGHGAIEGVASPEAANNADAQCKFIPMLTLGIPASGTMALMLGALTVHGITPGPGVMTAKPDLFWGLIASMWIGNLMLVVLNLPMVGMWVSLLKVPYRLLFPAIMVFSAIGIYSSNNVSFDVYLAALFGVLGIVWRVLACSPVPMLLGFVLGPMLEENLRRALQVSNGDPAVFLTRPISLAFILVTVMILVVMVLPAVRKRRANITG
jgi:putative tricarboxylic transport membrane protein